MQINENLSHQSSPGNGYFLPEHNVQSIANTINGLMEFPDIVL